jgi:5-methylcytosine-specific restriction endonuclease McrA
MKIAYAEKLTDPRWQKRRLEVMQRDDWKCVSCRNHTMQLEVHHIDYWDGKQPWEYDIDMLITLCHSCHKEENKRHRHEKYLMNSLKYSHFTAVDIQHLANLLMQDKKVGSFLRNKVRDFINPGR